MCKQSAVGQRPQHLCSYSTYKHALDDEKGANREPGPEKSPQKANDGFFHIFSEGRSDLYLGRVHKYVKPVELASSNDDKNAASPKYPNSNPRPASYNDAEVLQI